MRRSGIGLTLATALLAGACTSGEAATPATTTGMVATSGPTTTLLDEGVTRIIPVPSVVQTTTSTTLGFYATLPTLPLDEKLVVNEVPAGGPLVLPTDPAELEQLRQEVAASYENATMLVRQDVQDRQNGEPANIPALEAALGDPYLDTFARNRLTPENVPYRYELPETALYADADEYFRVHPLINADQYSVGVIDLWVCVAAETIVVSKDDGEVIEGAQRESARTARMRLIDGDWRLVGFTAVATPTPHKEDGGCWDHVPEPVY